MVPLQRRAVLLGAAGLISALAGCNGFGGGSSESSRTASPPGERVNGGPMSGSTSNAPIHGLRIDSDRPPVWFDDPDDPNDGRRTPRPGNRILDATVIDSATRGGYIAVADRLDRGPITEFLDATDFDRETVYLQRLLVRDCFEVELCQVWWSPTRIRTDYSTLLRPHDERCAVDEHVYEIRFIRLPAALEASRVNSFASSIGTGTCDSRSGGAEAVARSEGSSAGRSEPARRSGPIPTDRGAEQ